MSSLDNGSSRKIDKIHFETENDEKSFNETTASENSLSEVATKKRKISSSKSRQIKSKARPQSITSNNYNWDERGSRTDASSDQAVMQKHGIPQMISTASPMILHDIYCWLCLKTENTVECSYCPRAFHVSCVQSCFGNGSQVCSSTNGTGSSSDESLSSVCPECVSVMVAECSINIAPKWRSISVKQLNQMLLFVLLRLYHISGSSHFQVAVDEQLIKDYYTIIKHPVYLDLIKERVLNNYYTSVQAFHSDFKWILHNCTIYNGVTSVLTNYAKNIDKVCTKEINLMRSCPECFQQRMPFMIQLLKDQNKSSPTKSTTVDKSWEFSAEEEVVNEMWMTKLCNSVHCLVWVRLHNYPVWPGKLISLDDESALVLFFGDYDLNVVPLGSICIHTQSNHKRLLGNIANFSNRRASAPIPSANSVSKEYQLALEQLNLHLDCIRKKYDYFVIPPKKIEFNIQAGVDYYEKMRLQSKLESDVIVVNSIEDIGNTDDISEAAVSEKMDFRTDQEKCEKMDENSSVSYSSICHTTKVISQRDQTPGTSFIKSFESGMQSLLSQFKKEYMIHLKLTNQDSIMDDWPLSNCNQENQVQNVRQQTDPISVSHAAVQFSSKEFEKEEELKNYIKYLEKSLAAAEIEIRRQEILSAIHHEENMLEFSKQQKEIKKIYENDLSEVIKLIKNKFDERFTRAIQKAKLNEWCAFCSKLARFYCCWNTCYCNHECQSKHWEMHKATCTQVNRNVQSVILPKNPYGSSSTNSIPSMMQHIISKNGEIGGLNGSNIIEYTPNMSHKQRLPLKR